MAGNRGQICIWRRGAKEQMLLATRRRRTNALCTNFAPWRRGANSRPNWRRVANSVFWVCATASFLYTSYSNSLISNPNLMGLVSNSSQHTKLQNHALFELNYLNPYLNFSHKASNETQAFLAPQASLSSKSKTKAIWHPNQSNQDHF